MIAGLVPQPPRRMDRGVFKGARSRESWERAGRTRNSQMGYPHWLIVAGTGLVATGFIGVVFRRSRVVEPDQEPTEMRANWKRDGLDSYTATLPPWPWRPPPQAG
jgi:hypothetical protein